MCLQLFKIIKTFILHLFKIIDAANLQLFKIIGNKTDKKEKATLKM